MAWTAPLTAVTGMEFTAQQYNLYVRDNFLEMAPEKVTETGQYCVSTKLNEIGVRKAAAATVTTSQTTTSTSYTDLSTVGPSVTVEHGRTALVFIACAMSNNTSDLQCAMSFTVFGDSSHPASDKYKVKSDGVALNEQSRYSAARLVGKMTPGTSTFRAKYRVGGGTGTFLDRYICVVPL